jgi:DNA repair exonuclease SbcCD ATPase subunit
MTTRREEIQAELDTLKPILKGHWEKVAAAGSLALAVQNNGGSSRDVALASQTDEFKNAQASANNIYKEVQALEKELAALDRSAATEKNRVRMSNLAESIAQESSLAAEQAQKVKELRKRKGDLQMALLDANSQRMKISTDIEEIIQESAKLLASGQVASDPRQKIENMRSTQANAADASRMLEVAIASITDQLKAADRDLIEIERGVRELKDAKSRQEQTAGIEKALAAFRKAAPNHNFESAIVDALADGRLSKPNNLFRLEQTRFVEVPA